MAAFATALRVGSPGVELDVHRCATGELVVAHDDCFTARTAPGQDPGAPIEKLPWDAIKEIDVGSFFDHRFAAERPPLLGDVLDACCPAAYIDIELKTRATRDDPLPGLVAALLRARGPATLAAVTVSSFNPFALRAFKRACPEVPTAVIYCVDPEVPWALRRGAGRFIAGCDYVKPERRQATALNRALLTGVEGRPLVPWTVDDVDAAARFLGLGCAGLISNRPQDLINLIRRC